MHMREPVAPLIAAALVFLAIVVLVAYGMRARRSGRTRDARLAGLGRSPFLGAWAVEAFYWAMHGPGRLLARARIAPDLITAFAVTLAVAAAPAAASGWLALAGALFVAGAVLDALDGMVARANGSVSRAGGMLDSVLDRYADAAPLIGLAVLYRFSAWQMLVPLIALLGSFLLSYIRAKAEALRLDLPSGAMRRHERIVYIAAALVLGPQMSALAGSPGGVLHPATLVLVGIVAVASNVAAIRLTIAARRRLRAEQGEPPPRWSAGSLRWRAGSLGAPVQQTRAENPRLVEQQQGNGHQALREGVGRSEDGGHHERNHDPVPP